MQDKFINKIDKENKKNKNFQSLKSNINTTTVRQTIDISVGD